MALAVIYFSPKQIAAFTLGNERENAITGVLLDNQGKINVCSLFQVEECTAIVEISQGMQSLDMSIQLAYISPGKTDQHPQLYMRVLGISTCPSRVSIFGSALYEILSETGYLMLCSGIW